ncbi:MAG: PucR family transcriptional regulator ligand-binding domain-containing protein [Leifsonia sp.]
MESHLSTVYTWEKGAMLPTLAAVLRQEDLALTLLSDAATLPPGALDRPVQWVHSSDLADPTPFLVDDQVLLTTGTQFEATADVDAYVARLVARGVVGLGFGTEVVRAGTPDALVDACRTRGLPLFEVPYRVPFIAIARTTADLLAADAYARHTWALDAQRAISSAALRPDGLRAALAELARSLGLGVALFDAAGTLDRVFPADAIAPTALGGVRRDVTRLLTRGARASATVSAGPDTLTLHTLGRRGHLRGVLAVGGGTTLDQSAREVVASVVGLASLALERDRDLDEARSGMRSGVARLLLDGDIDLAGAVGTDLCGGMPHGEVRVAVIAVDAERRGPLRELLESAARTDADALFFGEVDGAVIAVVTPSGAALLERLASAVDARAGLSAPTAMTDLARARAQALRALGAASGPGVVDFEEIATAGVLSSLGTTDAREIARAILAPLAAHDAETGSDLLRTLRVWLENDARLDAAALALGVHRHTMRGRIAAAESVLGRDLSRFPARAELWAALLAAD